MSRNPDAPGWLPKGAAFRWPVLDARRAGGLSYIHPHNADPGADARRKIRRHASYFLQTVEPAGVVAPVRDGILESAGGLVERARRIVGGGTRRRLAHYPDSGLCVLRGSADDGAHLLFCLQGRCLINYHQHHDVLAVLFALDGVRLIDDPKAAGYGNDFGVRAPDCGAWFATIATRRRRTIFPVPATETSPACPSTGRATGGRGVGGTLAASASTGAETRRAQGHLSRTRPAPSTGSLPVRHVSALHSRAKDHAGRRSPPHPRPGFERARELGNHMELGHSSASPARWLSAPSHAAIRCDGVFFRARPHRAAPVPAAVAGRPRSVGVGVAVATNGQPSRKRTGSAVDATVTLAPGVSPRRRQATDRLARRCSMESGPLPRDLSLGLLGRPPHWSCARLESFAISGASASLEMNRPMLLLLDPPFASVRECPADREWVVWVRVAAALPDPPAGVGQDGRAHRVERRPETPWPCRMLECGVHLAFDDAYQLPDRLPNDLDGAKGMVLEPKSRAEGHAGGSVRPGKEFHREFVSGMIRQASLRDRGARTRRR